MKKRTNGHKVGPKMDLINEKNGTPLSIKSILIATHMSAHIEVFAGTPSASSVTAR